MVKDKKSPTTKLYQAYDNATSERGTSDDGLLSTKSNKTTQLLQGLLSQNMAQWWLVLQRNYLEADVPFI